MPRSTRRRARARAVPRGTEGDGHGVGHEGRSHEGRCRRSGCCDLQLGVGRNTAWCLVWQAMGMEAQRTGAGRKNRKIQIQIQVG